MEHPIADPAATRYVGIDLAWGERNTTAVVVLAGTGGDDPRAGATPIAVADALQTDDDLLAFVAAHDAPGRGLIVAVDAPTIVPNETGRRPCEAILSRCLRRHEAGAHPANKRLLAGPDGLTRGGRLAKRLADELSVPETPYLHTLAAPIRACFEAFPHPAHVALFGLEKTLKYKAKPNRDRETRLAEFRRYAALLQSLSAADPPLRLPDDPDPWWARDPAALGAAALKRHEDALDALTCAYVALHRRRWGDERSAVVGDLAAGYIVTPATDAMRACFAEAAASGPAPPLTPPETVDYNTGR